MAYVGKTGQITGKNPGEIKNEELEVRNEEGGKCRMLNNEYRMSKECWLSLRHSTLDIQYSMFVFASV